MSYTTIRTSSDTPRRTEVETGDGWRITIDDLDDGGLRLSVAWPDGTSVRSPFVVSLPRSAVSKPAEEKHKPKHTEVGGYGELCAIKGQVGDTALVTANNTSFIYTGDGEMHGWAEVRPL